MSIPRAEFHERQYELASNLELISGRGDFFTPPTQLERRLGIDVALVPGDARIWGVLGVPPPPGVRIGPSAFSRWPQTLPPGAQPPFVASLFIQYKRPDRLTMATANEWNFHRQAYYRIHLTEHQHRRLFALEQSVGADAVVRYAAPEFWRHQDMWLNQANGDVMNRSMLVSPSVIGPGHRRWTWVSGRRGIAHSEPSEGQADTVADLRNVLGDRRQRIRRDPRTHFRFLAEAVEEADLPRRPRVRWRDEVAASLEEPDEDTVEEFADLAVVNDVAARLRATWLILVMGGAQITAPAS